MTWRLLLLCPLAGLPALASSYGCPVGAEPTTLRAVIATESGGNPYAISINRPRSTARLLGHPGAAFLKRQPRSMTEAIRWTHELQDQGLQVSVGLMQINVETTRVPLSQLFDPCTNIAIGWDRLSMLYTDAADRVGEGQRALRMALSAYNSGGFTSALDYASKVARNAQ